MNSSTAPAGMRVDSAYDWTSGELCALTFDCHACGRPILSTQQHRRAETHTTTNGQMIGRTYFFHMVCAPGWAARSH